MATQDKIRRPCTILYTPGYRPGIHL